MCSGNNYLRWIIECLQHQLPALKEMRGGGGMGEGWGREGWGTNNVMKSNAILEWQCIMCNEHKPKGRGGPDAEGGGGGGGANLIKLVFIISECHQDAQGLHDRLTHALSFVICHHLFQHRQHEGTPQLRLEWGGGVRSHYHTHTCTLTGT